MTLAQKAKRLLWGMLWGVPAAPAVQWTPKVAIHRRGEPAAPVGGSRFTPGHLARAVWENDPHIDLLVLVMTPACVQIVTPDGRVGPAAREAVEATRSMGVMVAYVPE